METTSTREIMANNKVIIDVLRYLDNDKFIAFLDTIVSDLVKRFTIVLALTTVERVKYNMKPELLCHDIYKDSKLWFLILNMNGIKYKSDFNLQDVKIIKPGNLKDIMAMYNNSTASLTKG